MIYISERSHELYELLGENITSIKIDPHGVRVTNCVNSSRIHNPSDEDLTIVAGVNYLARENQNRAPRLTGINSDTLDEYLK